MKYLVAVLCLCLASPVFSQQVIKCGSRQYHISILSKTGYISLPLPAGAFGGDSNIVNISGMPVTIHCQKNTLRTKNNNSAMMVLLAGAKIFPVDTIAEKPAGSINLSSIDMGDGLFASAISYEFLSGDKVAMRRVGVAIAIEDQFLSLSTIQSTFDSADKLQRKMLEYLRQAVFISKKFKAKKFCPK